MAVWDPQFKGSGSAKPVTFDPGFNVGPPGIGLPGEDGVSPTVTTEAIDNGHRIRIEAANGVFTFDLFNGQQGDPGKDGVSPSISISAIGDGNRISITDAKGTKTFDVMDGKQGDPGSDGISPSVNVVQTADGYRVSITDRDGTKSFDLSNGKQGDPGAPGEDGISPTIAVAPITGGHRVTITDRDGAKYFDVLDGKDGGGSGGGTSGEDGGYYTPSVTGGMLSWTPSKADMPSVPSANVQGTPGKDGDDGVSPTVAVSAISGGNRLTITDAESTKTVDILNGKDGDPGTPGDDGYSPTATVTAIDGGHRVSITDKDGTKSFDVPDGSPGATGPNTVSTTTSTNITGILKGNGSTVEAAVPLGDYAPPFSASAVITASTTLQVSHIGSVLYTNSASAITLTVMDGASNLDIEINNVGAGTVTLSGTLRTGATTATAITIESGDAVAIKWSADLAAWVVVGNYGEA